MVDQELKNRLYKIKFPNELIVGDLIIINGYITKFIKYIQCNGMGSCDFGIYGYIYYNEEVGKIRRWLGYKNKINKIMVYKYLPVIICSQRWDND